MKNWDFNKSLRARGLNQGKLAALAQTSRSHLCQVVNNRPGRGGHTRRKLFAFLTVMEIRELGWLQEFYEWQADRAYAAGQEVGKHVPHGTKFQLSKL